MAPDRKEMIVSFWKRQSVIGPRVVLIAFAVLYFTNVLIRQSEKYFWYDEICTVFFSRFDILTYVRASRTGFELSQPMFHILTRASQAVLGGGRLGTRAPEILGFWVLCICMFQFLNRRLGLAAGIIAMLFPFFTNVFYYAYEARPYGLVLGFCGVSIICWQMFMEGKHPRLWLAALSGSLLLTCLLHSFALFASLPFLVAELYTTVRTRSIRWRFWLAVIIPAIVAIISYVPVMTTYRATVRVSSFGALAPHDWGQIARFYVPMLAPSFWLIISALIILSTSLIRAVSDQPSNRSSNRLAMKSRISAEEVIVAATFASLPVVGIFFAKTVHISIFDRYLCPTLVGICLLLAMSLSLPAVQPLGRPLFAALLAIAALWQLGGLLWDRYKVIPTVLPDPSSGLTLNVTLGGPLSEYQPLLALVDDQAPIATSYPLDFLYLAYYSPELRSRLYYVSNDPKDLFLRVQNNFRPFSPIKYNQCLALREYLRLAPKVYLIGFDWANDMTAIINYKARIRSLRAASFRFMAEVETHEVQ